MTLLTLLRSQVPITATVSAGSGYTVDLHYDETSGAVDGIGWDAPAGMVAVTVASADQPVIVQARVAGSGYAAMPAGHFLDDPIGVFTSWSAG